MNNLEETSSFYPPNDINEIKSIIEKVNFIIPIDPRDTLPYKLMGAGEVLIY